MSDHDFEKQVKVRLDQLKLRPSDAVWTVVQKNIRREKRRRRMIIWLPLLLLTLGAGGYFAMRESSRPETQDLAKQTITSTDATKNNKPSTQTSTQTQDNSVPTTNEQVTPPQPNTAGDVTTTEPAHPLKPLTDHQPTVKETAPPVITKSNSTRTSATNKLTPVRKIPADKTGKQPGKKTKKNITVDNTPWVAKNKPVRKPQQAKTEEQPIGKTDDKVVALAGKEDPTPVPDSSAIVTHVPRTDSSLAQANPIIDSAAKDSTQNLASLPKTPAGSGAILKTKQITRNPGDSKWQFGIRADGGYSGVTEDGLFGFLEKESPMVADLASPNVNNAFTVAPQFPRPVNKASSLSKGLSFSVGGFVQRKISNRLSLSAGLQYTYLSARQVVGTKINNNRTVNRAPSTSQLVSTYYDANNTQEYTNKYHFIELPVTLHAQLNKGKRLPITWDIGFSMSRLVSTNALHYDGLGGVYYKDNTLFNKTQWTASAGFNIRLFNQSKHPLSLGPVMRYNISPLLQKAYSTGQHLWSVGLRASVLLKK
jgi:hypothetical protein